MPSDLSPDAPTDDLAGDRSATPWNDIIFARDHLSTAGNQLSDAIGELVCGDIPVTREQADERQQAVERHIKDAERNIERAKRRLGVDNE